MAWGSKEALLCECYKKICCTYRLLATHYDAALVHNKIWLLYKDII